METRRIDELRVVGPFGAGKVLEAEMLRIAAAKKVPRPSRPKKPQPGTCVFPFDAELAQHAVDYCRVASRIHHDVLKTKADRLEKLFDELVEAEIFQVLGCPLSFSVQVKNVDDFAAGDRQVVGTIKNAILETAASSGNTSEVDPSNPDTVVNATILGDQLVISKLLTPESLSRRGWRLERTEAPMRENLAALVLMACRYDPRKEALIDPMCGSGTLPIEAGLLAIGAANRKSSDQPSLFPETKPTLWASDVDSNAVAITLRNAERADVAITTQTIPYQELTDLPDGLIVANLPYGERLEQEDLDRSIIEFESWARSQKNCRTAMIVPGTFDPLLLQERPRMDKPLKNGNLSIRLLQLR